MFIKMGTPAEPLPGKKPQAALFGADPNNWAT